MSRAALTEVLALSADDLLRGPGLVGAGGFDGLDRVCPLLRILPYVSS